MHVEVESEPRYKLTFAGGELEALDDVLFKFTTSLDPDKQTLDEIHLVSAIRDAIEDYIR